MSSSGIRLGAWDYLKWGHVRPIEKDGELVAAKIIVYAGEEEEYFSFISIEAYQALEDWINYRRDSGELISNESWLMRYLWDTRVRHGSTVSAKPRKLTSNGLKRLINRALWAQGLRTPLEEGKRRHPVQAIHSFRKWFKTKCEIGGMKPINIEKLMAHSIGISNSYYRPTEGELLQDFLKVMGSLSIEKMILMSLETAKAERQQEADKINNRLQDKEKQLANLKKHYLTLENSIEQRIENKVSQLLSKVFAS